MNTDPHHPHQTGITIPVFCTFCGARMTLEMPSEPVSVDCPACSGEFTVDPLKIPLVPITASPPPLPVRDDSQFNKEFPKICDQIIKRQIAFIIVILAFVFLLESVANIENRTVNHIIAVSVMGGIVVCIANAVKAYRLKKMVGKG